MEPPLSNMHASTHHRHYLRSETENYKQKTEFPLEHTQPSQYLVYIHLSSFSQHYVELFPY